MRLKRLGREVVVIFPTSLPLALFIFELVWQWLRTASFHGPGKKNSLKTESHFPQRGTSQGGGVIDISLLKEWDQKQSSPHTCTPSSLLITCCQELLWGQAGKCASLLGWAHQQSLRRRTEPLKRLLCFSIYQLGSEQAHLKKCCLSTPAGLARVLSKSNQFRICTDSPKRGLLMPKTCRNQGPFLHSTSSSGSSSGLEGDVQVQGRGSLFPSVLGAYLWRNSLSREEEIQFSRAGGFLHFTVPSKVCSSPPVCMGTENKPDPIVSTSAAKQC